MRSMRVFYSDPEHTCGQLVIASPDSQYKIFHFHHTGLDKLTHLFERWNAVKSKSAVGNDVSECEERKERGGRISGPFSKLGKQNRIYTRDFKG